MGDCISLLSDSNQQTANKKKDNVVVQGTAVSNNHNTNRTQAAAIPVATNRTQPSASSPPKKPTASQTSQSAVKDLQLFLESNSTTCTGTIQEQSFASVALTAQDAQQAQNLLWSHHVQRIRQERAVENAIQQVTLQRPNGNPITMKYWAKLYQPQHWQNNNNVQKIPLFIGLHGGGGCPPKVNDSQWENHKRIYDKTYHRVANSTHSSLLYVVPRAPTNNWNLWHEPHMDGLLDRLIETMVATRNVDSNRVYISGYSAGGDGIYMLSPRMADRWAAASMMAGHPNGVSLRGIYNLPFSLHVGGKDAAYNRNQVARKYKATLEQWQQQEKQLSDGRGYQHLFCKIYEQNAHGLGGQDAAAMQWMAQYTRDVHPTTVVWDKHSARHGRFYWILRANNQVGGGEIRVTRQPNNKVVIDLTKCPQPAQMEALTFRFNDTLVDMEQPVSIYRQENNERQLLQEVQLSRTIGALCQTLQERGDPNAIYSAQVKVDLQRCRTEDPKPKRLRGS